MSNPSVNQTAASLEQRVRHGDGVSNGQNYVINTLIDVTQKHISILNSLTGYQRSTNSEALINLTLQDMLNDLKDHIDLYKTVEDVVKRNDYSEF